MKELKETVALMESKDYKERFQAEYYQLETRYFKLKNIVEKWDSGTLEFSPTCSREIYATQLKYMKGYLDCLTERSRIENVNID